MIAKTLLKGIIQENQRYILNEIVKSVPRENVNIPEKLKKVVALYGVRRSGKTYILYDIFQKNRDISLYIDFEDERLTEFDLKDFETLKSAFFELNPNLIDKEAVFLLDEIQNIEGWEKFCRRTAEKEKIKVFVSGSSSKLISKELHTALRGRSWGIEVFPFSFREYLNAVDCDRSNKFNIKTEFNNFLKWGGFPEVATLAENNEKTKVLREYLDAMFFKDIVERNNVTNIQLITTMMDSLLSSPSLKFSLNSFYKQYKDKFPLSKDLLHDYYKYFIESMLVFETRMFSPSSYIRMRNPAKIYLVDTGIAKRTTSADSGRLLENAVFLEFRRQGYTIYYLEKDFECDFIMKDADEKLMAVQVCYELNENSQARETGGIVKTCRLLDLKEGYILTADQENELEIEGINVHIIPFWKLCLK